MPRRGDRGPRASPPCPEHAPWTDSSSCTVNWSSSPPGTTPASRDHHRPPQRTSPNSSPWNPHQLRRPLQSFQGEKLERLPPFPPPPAHRSVNSPKTELGPPPS